MRFYSIIVCTALLVACTEQAWNDPYRYGEAHKPVFFSSFSERPKHLDPARSYSSNEWSFISQIYESPLQYHFLRRPYSLVPLTAESMPQITYYAADGSRLSEDAPAADVAYTDYVLRIRPGILYQPHPALAKKADGSPVYWPLDPALVSEVNSLSDFSETGTRELVAADYIYQIKRLAFAPNHSPIASLMAEHIRGFADFSEHASAAHKKLESEGADPLWLDLRTLPMDGVEVLDRYSYRIRIEKKYPQFIFWLAMNFFAPMPWEAERFYQQPGLNDRNISLHWYPVGTGPFMLTENNPNLRMVLVLSLIHN